MGWREAYEEELKADKENANGPEWACTGTELYEIFTVGIRVDYVEYREDSRDLIEAWNGITHDESSNKYRVTSIATKMKIVHAAKKRVPGGDWGLVIKDLQKIYGDSKKTTIRRWVNAAKGVSPVILDRIKARRDFPQQMLFDNKFLMGTGEDAKFRLTDDYGIAALNLLFDQLDSGMNVHSDMFKNEFCTPMKQVEIWVTKQRRNFGALCDRGTFTRISKMLIHERGRLKVLHCIRANVPLGGMPGSASETGIEECRTITQELARLKAAPSTAEAVGGAQPEGTGGGMTPQEGGDVAPLAGDDDVNMLSLDAAVAIEDPVKTKAMSLSQPDLNRISMHVDNLDTFTKEVTSRVLPSQKVIFVVDCPTSKAKVVLAMIERVAAIVNDLAMHRYIMLIPVGHRFDLLNAVTGNVKIHFPRRRGYVIQCVASDMQADRIVPSYVVFIKGPGCESEPIPAYAKVNTCKAMSYEGLRLRCCDRACKLRRQDQRLRQTEYVRRNLLKRPSQGKPMP